MNHLGTPSLFVTNDGSHSLLLPGVEEHYHSTHGAIQESKHVYIHAGLNRFAETQHPIHILEVGMGTGLNALLSYEWSLNHSIPIHYTTLEAFPLPPTLITQLNYPQLIGTDPLHMQEVFEQMHAQDWDCCRQLRNNFQFCKYHTKLENFKMTSPADLIYYDAFAPRVQPELWTTEIFGKLFQFLKKDGIFVTYCAKGEVKRNLKSAGFLVESIPGPPGKREMTRAIKRTDYVTQ